MIWWDTLEIKLQNLKRYHEILKLYVDFNVTWVKNYWLVPNSFHKIYGKHIFLIIWWDTFVIKLQNFEKVPRKIENIYRFSHFMGQNLKYLTIISNEKISYLSKNIKSHVKISGPMKNYKVLWKIDRSHEKLGWPMI